MINNYLKVTARVILKYKVFSFINVAGLAMGMTVGMLLMLMMADRSRYDAFHSKRDRIYRILSNPPNSRQPYATSVTPLASALKSGYSNIEDAATLDPSVGGDMSYQGKSVETRGYFTDESFFRIFDFELQKGDKTSALKKPNAVILSAAVAKKLFGDSEPIGKIVELDDRKLAFPIPVDGQDSPPVSWGNFEVTGVIDLSKYKSHISFDVLMSSSTKVNLIAAKKVEDYSNNWDWFFRIYTYALLREGATDKELAASLDDLAKRKYTNIAADHARDLRFIPQELSDVQLGLMGNDTNNRMPDIGYYFLSVLAIIILALACFNYTSLSVARALTRTKEIGIRKVTGAKKGSLVAQFLLESVATAVLAGVTGILLLQLVSAGFKSLWLNRHLGFELEMSPDVLFAFLAFSVVVGIIAGLYPAFYLARFQPLRILKHTTPAPGKFTLRKILSVTQFVFSLFFITTSILVYNQFQHYLNFDYGFTSSNIVNINLQGADADKVQNEFRSVAGVVLTSACDIIPAAGTNNGIQLRATEQKEFTPANIIHADENFIDNLGLALVAGRNLPEYSPAASRYIVVNETAVSKLGYTNANEIIGQTFETNWDTVTVQVVGVVKNFRHVLLINHDKIEPLILRNEPKTFKFVNVKLSEGNKVNTLEEIRERWSRIDPAHPLKYDFFEDELASTHRALFDITYIIGYMALLAVIIACLGLLGMATYASERRTKEIGIRKILGAATQNVAITLSKEFFVLLGIAFVIGIPFSYFVNNLWLENLPNRVEFGMGVIIWATIITFVLGAITIISQTIRVARRNPVDTLKME